MCCKQVPDPLPTPSQESVAAPVLASVGINSYIRGYHAYQDNWTPSIGEELVLRREPDNSKDHFAVTRDGEIVGPGPFNLSSIFSQFLRRHYNTAIAAQQYFHF